MQLEARVVKFWMEILPEIQSDKKKFNRHLQNYLEVDTVKALQEYFKDENTDYNMDLIPQPLDIVDSPLFSSFFYQFIYKYHNRIEELINRISLVRNKKEFIKFIYDLIYKKLFSEGYLVLVNELNIYRENELLDGHNLEEQFKCFNSDIIQSLKFFELLNKEYPMFVEGLSNRVIQIVNYLEEVLLNTENEVTVLKELYSFDLENKLEDIQFLGDPHNHGKCVCLLTFATGKLIYKPKSLQLEKQFQSLINYLNGQIPDLSLYEMKIHTKKSHGWCEFIEYEPCKSQQETINYYKRIGKLLAVLHSLNGVDFHYENIIVKGENPVLVDLEALFMTTVQDNLSDNESAFLKASDILKNSVLSIGLLPTKMKLNKEEAVQIGALDQSHSYDITMPSLTNMGLSTMKVQFEKKQVSTGHQSISNTQVNNQDLRIFIERSFSQMYDWILTNKDIYIDLINELFLDCQVRILIKPTMVYSKLITAAKHPDFLTKVIHKKVVLSRIGLLTENKEIAQSEIEQLSEGDIPYFVANFDEGHLFYYIDRKIENALYETPKENFIKKMNSLSETDLNRQLDFIRKSFFKKEPENEIPEINFKAPNYLSSSKGKYFNLAKEIADYLKAEAIFGVNDQKNEDVIWLDTSVGNLDFDDWTPEVTSYDLYNGLSGLAIFFMNLEKVSQSHDNRKLIDSIVLMIKNYLTSSIDTEKVQTGMMTGLSGMILTLYEYGELYNIDEEEFVQNQLMRLKKEIPNNDPLDYISGNIGVLALSIKIMKRTQSVNLYKTTQELAELVITDIDEQLNSIVLFSIKGEAQLYSGFSHGLSGVIYYLYDYFNLSKDINVYNLFKRCLEYQRKYFWDEVEKDWNVSLHEEKFAYGWCHGSPGVLLEKMKLRQLNYIDDILDSEINNAVVNLIDNIETNISLCHGALGNILILNKYAIQERDKKLKLSVNNAFESCYRFIVNNIDENNEMSYKQFKGLLLGLAGIGDFMLRVFAEDKEIEFIDYLW